MSTPHTRDERRAANSLRDMKAIAETADILRQVAAHDGHLVARCGYVSTNLAALVDAIGRACRDVSPVIARCVIDVVVAVDRATGQRRQQS